MFKIQDRNNEDWSSDRYTLVSSTILIFMFPDLEMHACMNITLFIYFQLGKRSVYYEFN
jgi:hypothetical protein